MKKVFAVFLICFGLLALAFTAAAQAPSISVDPESQTNFAGTTASFSVTASGSYPLIYQWQFNGTNLSGETFTNLNVLNVQETNAGSYTVVIMNASGSVTSAAAVLSVHYALTATAGFGGTLSKSPDQLSYAPSSSVDLTATADPGFIFTGWSGDANGTSNPLTVTLSGHSNITANFMGPGAAIVIDNNDPSESVHRQFDS